MNGELFIESHTAILLVKESASGSGTFVHRVSLTSLSSGLPRWEHKEGLISIATHDRLDAGDDETAISDTPLCVGMRVRINGAPFRTTLTAPAGTVVEEEEWGTYIVKLDSPALYRGDDGAEESINEIRELPFNLSPLP